MILCAASISTGQGNKKLDAIRGTERGMENYPGIRVS